MLTRPFHHPGLDLLLERLANPKPSGSNRWVACCPAHGSGHNQALSVCLQDDRILIHCFGGCKVQQVLKAIGLTWRELYQGTDRLWNPIPQSNPTPQPDLIQGSKLEWVWNSARPVTQGDGVAQYLASRGLFLDSFPDVLRYHPGLEYYHEEERLGTFPVLLARVEHPIFGLVALHRTYLDPKSGGKAIVPSPKKLTKPVFEGATKGAAICLYPPSEILAVTEGLETGLGVHLATGRPVWVGISAGGLARLEIPASVSEVVICADHDHMNPNTGTRAGEAAAHILAGRLMAQGKTVRLAIPPQEGMDWLDLWCSDPQCCGYLYAARILDGIQNIPRPVGQNPVLPTLDTHGLSLGSSRPSLGGSKPQLGGN